MSIENQPEQDKEEFPPAAKEISGIGRRAFLEGLIVGGAGAAITTKIVSERFEETERSNAENEVLSLIFELERKANEIKKLSDEAMKVSLNATDTAYLITFEEQINQISSKLGAYEELEKQIKSKISKLDIKNQATLNQKFDVVNKTFQEIKKDIDGYTGPTAFKRMFSKLIARLQNKEE